MENLLFQNKQQHINMEMTDKLINRPKKQNLTFESAKPSEDGAATVWKSKTHCHS